MIYFVLPVYNEEKNIARVISKLRSVMSGKGYKIIAVNDGSADKSLAILKKLKKADLVIETYPVNMNIGAVFSTGITSVLAKSKNNHDVIVIMESDQTSEISLVKKLIKEIEVNQQDIVIASRYQAGGQYKNFPFLRTLFSRSANGLMHLYFPIKGVFDYTIFFRAYRVKVLRQAVKNFGSFGLIQSKGYVANAELLVKLSLITQRIKEIPFVYNYGKKKGTSKINIFRTINEYFVLINYLKRIFIKWQKK
jgi:dolichol-phosphate mannosyltransferase